MKLILLCLLFLCGCAGFRNPPYTPIYRDEVNVSNTQSNL